jgi:hypothetical protein
MHVDGLMTVTVEPVNGQYRLWCATAEQDGKRAVVVSDTPERAEQEARSRLAAALSALNTFMNNGQKAVAHDNASTRFAAVDGSIQKCMAVPKAHRVACDVALERYTNMMVAATGAAPPL